MSDFILEKIDVLSLKESFKKSNPTDGVASLLRTAADYLDNGGIDRRGSAYWRIADAGLMLREIMVIEGYDKEYLDTPTGRGAIIPKKHG